MGYRAEPWELGTFWNRDEFRTTGFDPARVPEFLAEAQRRYEGRPFSIDVSGRRADAALGPALVAAGCAADWCELYLAHVGKPPEPRATPGATFAPVDEATLRDACATRLRSFANSEDPPNPERLRLEIENRGAELTGFGRGMLASVGDEVAAVIFWYDEPEGHDPFVFLLGTRLPFRGRALAERLLADRVREAYAAGRRTVLLSVLETNAPALSIYRRLGFRDEVNWQRRYLWEPGD